MSQHEKAQRVVLFMAYLYMNDGMRDEQIKRSVTGVAYMFEIKGFDAEFFNLAIVSRGRKASLRSVEECVVQEKVRTDKVIVPVCLDIVLQVRQQYWVNQNWEKFRN